MIGKRTEEEVVAFIDAYWSEYWTSPSYDQIGLYVGLSSKSTVSVHMHRLVKKGLLEKKGSSDTRRGVLFRRAV